MRRWEPPLPGPIGDAIVEATFESSLRPLPSQSEAHKYYKLILPLGLLCGYLPLFLICQFVLPRSDVVELFANVAGRILAPSGLPNTLFSIVFWLMLAASLLFKAASAYVKCSRLCEGLKPAPPSPRYLTHVVVVPEYKEPLTVLCMTLDSLAAQSHPPGELHVVIASEANVWPRTEPTPPPAPHTHAPSTADPHAPLSSECGASPFVRRRTRRRPRGCVRSRRATAASSPSCGRRRTR